MKNIIEDEIPLTHSSPITQQTRARFETLFRAAVRHEKEKGKIRQVKKGMDHTKREKQNRTQKYPEENLTSEIDFLSSSSFCGENYKSNGKSSYIEESHIESNEVHVKSSVPVSHNENENLKGKKDLKMVCFDRDNISGKSTMEVNDTISFSKPPIPLPRNKFSKSSDAIVNKSSDDESDGEAAQSLVVTALINTNNESPHNRKISDDKRHTSKSMDHSQIDEAQLIQQFDDDSNGDDDVKEDIQFKSLNPDSAVNDILAMTSSYRKKDDLSKVNSDLHEEKVKSSRHIKKSSKTKLSNKKEVSEMPSHSDNTKSSNIYDYNKIIGIFIHRTDYLKADALMQHPLVKVHFIDSRTGDYVKKSDAERPVVSYFDSSRVDYILPVMTGHFDFKERRSIVPNWEELLVFNEDIEYLYQTDTPIIILFEILDFVDSSIVKSRLKKMGTEGGWHKIAWAFLKPVGKNGVRNTEKTARLQLYKPQKTSRMTACKSCEPYFWWRNGVLDRYPSSLYVTVKGVLPPEHLHPALRSQSALQGESGSCIIDMGGGEQSTTPPPCTSVSQKSLVPLEDVPVRNWSRLPSQSCKIPNHKLLELPTTSRGCFTIKFSNSGLLLACAMVTQQSYPIFIYAISDGKEYAKLVGHQGLVYDLNWSIEDSILMSASADCTVCIWDTRQARSQYLQMLPHPSFVYCADFYPESSSLLATGCYDHVVRIWVKSKRSKLYELFQELEGHSGYINSLCFNKHCHLLTGDNIGNILIWIRSSTKSKSDWKLQRNMKIGELKGVTINKILSHPGGQRIIVHSKDSLLRMIDIASGCIIQWFRGAFNYRIQTSSCISPCGGLLFASSEDNTVSIWNVDTGEMLAQYSGLGFKTAVTSIDYHPHEHMVTFASYGSAFCVLVCDYQLSLTNHNIILHILSESNNNDETSSGYVKTERFNTLKSLNKDSAMFAKTHSTKSKVTLDKVSNEIVSSPSTSFSVQSSTRTNELPLITNEKKHSGELNLITILEKMDQVLSFASSKTSTQFSDSSVNTNIKRAHRESKNIIPKTKQLSESS